MFKVVAPVTCKVPAENALPVTWSTVNLFVLIVKSLSTSNVEYKWLAPVTPNVPPTLAFKLTPKPPDKVTAPVLLLVLCAVFVKLIELLRVVRRFSIQGWVAIFVPPCKTPFIKRNVEFVLSYTTSPLE